MLRPSIFGESFLNDWNDWDNWMNFSFPDVEKKLYGKHAAHVMKTDIKEHDDGYELVVDLPGFKKDQVQVELKDGYLTISAEKGLEKDDKEKEKAGRQAYARILQLSYCRGRCGCTCHSGNSALEGLENRSGCSDGRK